MSGSNFLATPIASMERSAGSLTTKARRVETNLLDDGIDKCVRISRRDPGGCTRFFDRTRACLVECLGKHLTCRSFPDVADTVLNYGKEIAGAATVVLISAANQYWFFRVWSGSRLALAPDIRPAMRRPGRLGSCRLAALGGRSGVMPRAIPQGISAYYGYPRDRIAPRVPLSPIPTTSAPSTVGLER